MRRLAVLMAVLALLLTALAPSAFAQSASDDQYIDPCANGACDPGQKNAKNASANPPAGSGGSSDGGGSTGLVVGLAALGGLGLAAGGFTLARRSKKS